MYSRFNPYPISLLISEEPYLRSEMGERTHKLLFHIIVAIFFFVSWRGILNLNGSLKRTGNVYSQLATRFLTNWNFVSTFILTVLCLNLVNT